MWAKGQILNRLDDRSYEIQTGNKILRRNRVHLKLSNEPISEPPSLKQPSPAMNSEQNPPLFNQQPRTSTKAVSPKSPAPSTPKPLAPPKPSTPNSLTARSQATTNTPRKTSNNQDTTTPITSPIASRSRSGRAVNVPSKYKEYVLAKSVMCQDLALRQNNPQLLN